MASSAGAVRAGGAYVEIFAKDGQFQQALTRVQNRMKAVAASMRSMGTNMTIGGAALGAPFVVAAQEAAGFTLAMAQVRANTGATEEQFKALNKAAREMGVAFGRSPTETANAMSELAKAGLDAQGVMSATGPVLALAAADNMTLARSVEVVVGTMSQFGMATSDFSSIADRLQAAANASVTSVDLIGESLSYVGPQAAMAGQSFDSVAAALGTLAQGGIRGSMAGTQMARVLESMATEEGKFNKLGVSVRDLNGNLRPFMDVLRDLGVATGGMNNADRMQAFMDIFDIRGARAAATLSQLGGEFDRILGTIQNSTGAAAGKAAAVLDSFGGQMQILAARFADLKIAVITSMGDTATNTIAALGRIIGAITVFAERNPRLFATIAAVAGGLLALGVAAITVSIAIKVLAAGISTLRTVMQILPALASPVGVAILGIGAACTAAVVVARTLSPAFREETDAIMAAVMAMDFGTAWEIMNLNFAIALTQMGAKASSVLGQISGFFAATGSYIADTLIGGLDSFMGVFGTDIITLQAGFKALGLGIRAAFDWKFALTGLSAAIAQVEREAEAARARAPTAAARAADRTTARQAAADDRQRRMDENAQGFADTVETLREDLQRAKDRLKPKPAEEAAAAQTAAGVAAANAGVMPVAAAAAAAGDGKFGSSAGTFGSGAGLGIASEIGSLEGSSAKTAANTTVMAQAMPELAKAMQAAGGQGPAVPAVGGVAVGGAAANAAAVAQVPAMAQQAQAGAAAAANTGANTAMASGFQMLAELLRQGVVEQKTTNRHLGNVEAAIKGMGAAFA